MGKNNLPLSKPLITVITVVYNGEKFIKQTILSVINQTYDNIEYIIVDGKSSDNTLDIINRYKNEINTLISEKDRGISDAMNKGLSVAKGNYIIFLHADDYFASNEVIEKAVDCIEGDEDILIAEIYFGQNLKRFTSRGFNFWINFKTGIHHQGSICHRRLFEKIGAFDINIKIAMDYDFFLRAFQHKVTYKRCPVILSVMRETGVSSQSDWESLVKRFAEEKKIHQKNCRSLLMKLIYFSYWLMYIPYRRLMYLLYR